ncbi:MAG: response regulator [Succinivibrio sp.]|nr:response regulator [Succinivibrio sp.]
MNPHKIVVISGDSSFTVNAAVKALKANYFETRIINPVQEELLDAVKYAEALVIFVGTYVSNFEYMTFLGETIGKMQLKVILAGAMEQCDSAEQYLPRGFISDRMYKPIVISQLVSSLKDIFTLQDSEARKKILLVDDDPTFLKMIRTWLSESYDTVPVNSGAQAIQYLATHNPDLILLDYEMPILNGPQVLQSIKAEENLRDIPVFFLTSVDERSSVTKAISLKPNGYLLKSYDKNKLLTTINNFFDSAQK